MRTAVAGDQDPYGRDEQNEWYGRQFFEITQYLGDISTEFPIRIIDNGHPTMYGRSDTPNEQVSRIMGNSLVEKQIQNFSLFPIHRTQHFL